MNCLKVPALLLTRSFWPWLVVGLLLSQGPSQAQSTPGTAPISGTASASPTSGTPPIPPGTDPIAPAASADAAAPAPIKSSPAAHKPSTPRDTRPHWSELSPAQRQALRPLAEAWSGLSELHKRKWLVLSHNFAELSPQEQLKLQDRMSDWANLTARERAQARLHFAEVRQLPDDERRAKWEAYQALSDEQRRKLADDMLLEPPRGAAVASRPVAASKLTLPPAAKPDQVLQPRIDTDQIHPKTLLPHFLQGTSTR